MLVFILVLEYKRRISLLIRAKTHPGVIHVRLNGKAIALYGLLMTLRHCRAHFGFLSVLNWRSSHLVLDWLYFPGIFPCFSCVSCIVLFAIFALTSACMAVILFTTGTVETLPSLPFHLAKCCDLQRGKTRFVIDKKGMYFSKICSSFRHNNNDELPNL